MSLNSHFAHTDALTTITPDAPLLHGFSLAGDSATERMHRVLIVDDEESIRRLFSYCLSPRYTCVTAASVEEALACLAESEYSLVITDMMMPGLSGIELLRKIMHSHKDTAVIMVSGIDRAQRALDAVRLGAFDYLIKPCDMDVLEISVERALERRDLLLSARYYKQDLEVRNVELARRQAELQRLQAQLVHSEKMASLGQLAAGIAHEINNPVGFIHGNLEMLEDCATGLIELVNYYDSVAPQLPAPVLEEVAKIKNRLDFEASLDDLSSIIADSRGGAERIRDIVQNLRTFSRLDEAEFKKADVQEGIESTVRLLSRYYTAGHVQLTRDYTALPPVDCYAGQLNQVWMNLLANAAQAIGADAGEVCIATRLEGDCVVISISDTGSGIPDHLLTKIFDPFFTTKPVGEGTGLGLSITFGIIERHNGTIEVTSAPGKGTTFTVRLPVNATSQPAAESLAAHSASPHVTS